MFLLRLAPIVEASDPLHRALDIYHLRDYQYEPEVVLIEDCNTNDEHAKGTEVHRCNFIRERRLNQRPQRQW